MINLHGGFLFAAFASKSANILGATQNMNFFDGQRGKLQMCPFSSLRSLVHDDDDFDRTEMLDSEAETKEKQYRGKLHVRSFRIFSLCNIFSGKRKKKESLAKGPRPRVECKKVAGLKNGKFLRLETFKNLILTALRSQLRKSDLSDEILSLR